MPTRSRLPAGLVPAVLAAVLVLADAPPAAAITGVCPDGSIFIVQTMDAVPCSEARRVDPTDMPPIQPKLLPRPYGWERFHRRADPNNPYNLVADPTAQGGAPPPPDPGYAPPTEPGYAPPPAPSVAPPPVGTPVPPTVAAFAPARAPGLALDFSADEIADLDEIVGLVQGIAPATLARYAPDGERRAVVQLAYSPAFEERVRGALAREGAPASGRVVLFRAEAQAAEAFHGQLTFVQGHVAFHPDPENPRQLGAIDGALGPLAPGERVLGYAVLPEHLDPSQPLDVYWDDRRITATLRPL